MFVFFRQLRQGPCGRTMMSPESLWYQSLRTRKLVAEAAILLLLIVFTMPTAASVDNAWSCN